MDTNELIKISRARIDVLKDSLENDVYAGKQEVNEINYHQAVIATLSRTRIRETAKEPPTREDADRYGYVLAFYSNGVAGIRYYAEAVRFPSVYPHWTQLPVSPSGEADDD